MKKQLVITLDRSPLVTLDMPEFVLPTSVLDWYATEYDFDRRRLGGALVDKMEYTGPADQAVIERARRGEHPLAAQLSDAAVTTACNSR